MSFVALPGFKVTVVGRGEETPRHTGVGFQICLLLGGGPGGRALSGTGERGEVDGGI